MICSVPHARHVFLSLLFFGLVRREGLALCAVDSGFMHPSLQLDNLAKGPFQTFYESIKLACMGISLHFHYTLKRPNDQEIHTDPSSAARTVLLFQGSDQLLTILTACSIIYFVETNRYLKRVLLRNGLCHSPLPTHRKEWRI